MDERVTLDARITMAVDAPGADGGMELDVSDEALGRLLRDLMPALLAYGEVTVTLRADRSALTGSITSAMNGARR